MRKAYITDWRDKATTGMKTPVEVFFTFAAEEAHPWPSKEHAQSLCAEFDSYGVKVPWAEGGDYVCKGFQVEERSPRQFLIFCEGPFTFKATGEKDAA
jgi:hypothetical protein